MVEMFLFPYALAAAVVGSSVSWAAAIASRGRFRPVSLWPGLLVALSGLGLMSLIAAATARSSGYDDALAPASPASAMGAAAFLIGLGPFVPWAMGPLARLGAAGRHLAGRVEKTAPMVALTMAGTAVAIGMMIVAMAVLPQEHAAAEFLEEEFRPSLGWLFFAVPAGLVALAAAWAAAATSGPAGSRRVADAGRMGLAASWGSAMGTVAGCVAGTLLAKPFALPEDWSVPYSVPYEAPWAAIGLVAVGIPVVAVGIGLIYPPKPRKP
ncbi:hypothetical protein OIE66_41600 [Nonomuraea sp. NBC_01738]|uniref:hypothetical protein n=1 Tax=Nonomuraea sp. NBC_01738 TaxID=2976003 RepID=UPI002E0D7529|nr:hypothetical protein OIE66_41600 [Nonomuraea sp. NBC_01738]